MKKAERRKRKVMVVVVVISLLLMVHTFYRFDAKYFAMASEEKQQEFREIDNFICTYPMKSPIRKNWDSSSMMRKMIDEAAGII